MSDQASSVAGQNRSACLVCRSRKVKCGKELPECNSCRKLGVRCPGYDTSTGGELAVERIYRESSIEKRRVGSCNSCRRMKVKCDRLQPSCRRCRLRKQRCTYTSVPVGSYAWLFDDRLPEDPENLLMLINIFFDRIYPLRCLGFIHKPSFIHALDQGRLIEEFGEPLVQIVCAFGAFIHTKDIADNLRHHLANGQIPGELWATNARNAVLLDLATPTLRSAMAMVLIAEYAAMSGRNAWGFLLVGSAARVLRLLELDVPKTMEPTLASPEAIEVESSRRLLWACYLLDAQIGSGVDKNLNWRDDVPQIPLPSPEEAFACGTISGPEETATLSSFTSLPERIRVNLRANLVYLGWLRSQILRLNRVSESALPPWDEKSTYLQLLHTVESWYDTLPGDLRLTDLNIYVHKERNTLAAVFMLHFAYHSAVADLTRVSLPGFEFPLSTLFKNAPPSFRRQCQERCRHHADEVSKLVELGLATGGMALEEQFCITSAFEATKIQVVHTTTQTLNGPEERRRAADQIAANLKLITTPKYGQNPRARNYVSGLLPLLSKFGFQDLMPRSTQEPGVSDSEQEVEVVGPADTNHLSQVANFRQALSEVQAQLKTSSPAASQPSGNTPPVATQQTIIPAITAHASVPIIQPPPPPEVPALGMEVGLAAHGYHLGEDVNYMQLAEEMSNYMTWDFSELPPWIDFDHQVG
ncbi:hypothetical protein BGZ63DRAFT_148513 [Mariannaea sp. PMI_226]|nr:hypothetical protein BGZ63DRAFT_148513 [Mariannaea sp. PMI_226]